jgi:PadR family transcriptional regulator AphA
MKSTPATTDYAIAGLLSIRPMSGYELKQWSGQCIGRFWSESYGQIYPALARMQRAGHIAVKEAGPKPAGGPKTNLKASLKANPRKAGPGRERRVYELTAKGRGLLEEWLPGPCREQVPRHELLLKLFFGAEAPLGVSRSHLKRQREIARTRLADYAGLEKQLRVSADLHAVWWRMTLRLGILDARASLAWCEESLDTLDELKKARKRRKEG